MSTRTIKPFARQGHFTMIDNYVIDEIMPQVSPNGWKVLCFVMRKTIGWQKDTDNISLSQITEGTGIKNRTTANKAITELEEKQYIKVIRHGDNITPNTFRLNTEFTATIEGSTENRPPPSTENGLGVVQKIDTQKKDSKEINTTTTGAALLQEVENLVKINFFDPTANETNATELKATIMEYGLKPVLESIKLALSPERANGKPKQWGYVKGILRNGGPDKKQDKKRGKQNGTTNDRRQNGIHTKSEKQAYSWNPKTGEIFAYR